MLRDPKMPALYPFYPEDSECKEYALNGERAWITIENISLLIVRWDNGVSITAFPLGRENKDPISEMVLWNEDFAPLEEEDD